MKYTWRGRDIMELSDDEVKQALEKHMQTPPEKEEDVLVYNALTVEWNKRYEEQQRKYHAGEA